MRLGFSEVEAVLRHLHSVSDTEASQFRARLRNLQRVGLSITAAEGAGRRKNYPAASVLKLAVAVELLQIGMPPERAAILTSLNWPSAANEFLAARRDWLAEKRVPRYFVAEPNLLGDADYTRTSRFLVMTDEEMATFVKSRERATIHYRILAINLAGLLARTVISFNAVGVGADGLLQEMDEAPRDAIAPVQSLSGFFEADQNGSSS